MKFEQDTNNKMKVINCGESHTYPAPEVGKVYRAFDDGKIRRSRLMYYKITEAIDLDNDKVDEQLLKDLADEINACYWLYNPEQTIIYKAMNLNEDGSEDKDTGECYFLRTNDNGWFGALAGWFCSELDTDEHLYNMMLEEEAEEERRSKFIDKYREDLVKAFPELMITNTGGWFWDLVKSECNKVGSDLLERLIKYTEEKYQVKFTKKQINNICKYLFDLEDYTFFEVDKRRGNK